MYKTKAINDLSIKLEAGEISPSDCLSILSTMNFERLSLKERCEGILMLQYVEKAKRRAREFDKDPVRSDAFLQIKDAWRNSFPLTNQKVIENIKYTKAYESGLIDVDKLVSLDVTCKNFDFKSAMDNLRSIIL